MGDFFIITEIERRARESGCTVLFRQAMSDPKMAHLFIGREGTDVNSNCNPDGWTALHAAAYKGDLDLCVKLVAAGADLRAEGKSGCERVMRIASSGTQTSYTPELVHAGKEWPVLIAASQGHTSVVEYLVNEMINN